MPRSFLVKRRKSDTLDINPEAQIGKEGSCEAGLLNHYKAIEGNDSYSTKNWYIEYHPTVPPIIPRKGCTASHHGNTRPCYLCHHGNMIPSHNGCIKYTPIQVPARYNGMCYCVLCQQRPAPMACNCQSCLSLRFEQTAASVLGPSEKELSVKPGLCCGGMRCDRMSIEHIKYEYCQCAQCVDRMSRETQFHNNVHAVQRHDRPKIHVIQNNSKDQNNNDSQNEKTEGTHEPNTGGNGPGVSNGHVSPTLEVRACENHKHYTSWTTTMRKRKHEDSEQIIISKVIKTETPMIETSCEDHGLSQTVRDEEKSEVLVHSPVKQSKEERDVQHTNIKEHEDNMKESESNIQECVSKSCMHATPCHKNGFNLDDEDHTSADIGMDKNHNHHTQNPRGRGRRHYNTRLTTTKPHAFETDFVVPVTAEWKQDKELYSEISKSRQRSKLNRLLANEHERRRVAQLNSAYQDLRQLIPGYQCDTKLPKIKILRYAINYIAHLDNILEVGSDE